MASRNATLTGERDGTAWSTRGAVAVGSAKKGLRYPKQVRAASNANFIPTGYREFSGTRLHLICRFKMTIGSGARSDLRASFLNFVTDPSGVVDITNAYTIEGLAFELDGASYSVPVYFNGSLSATVPAGAAEVKSDPVSAWCFGRAYLPVGTDVWVRLHVSVSTDGHRIPSNMDYFGAGGGSFPDWVGWVYDPSENPGVSSVYGTGAISLGNGAGNGSRCSHMILTGRFVDEDPATYAGIGTSIMQNASDSLSGYGYAGFFARALVNSSFNGSWKSGINFGSSGTTTFMWTGGTNIPKLSNYLKYCKNAVDEYGTNDIYFGTSLAALQTGVQGVWTILRAAGIRNIIRTGIIPRTDSTNGWIDAAGQTPITGFTASGTAGQFNTWLSGQVGSLIQAYVPMTTVRDSGDAWKWRTTGVANATVDFIGTHPTDVTHADMGGELRPVVATFA